MTFTESVKTGFQKYMDFSGRASRSEYWWFFLFTLIVRLVTTWIPFVGFVIALALLLPSLSVTTRRLHDTNRTGWWMLLPIGLGLAAIIAGVVLGVGVAILGSVVGFLTLLSFLIQPSDPYANQYGPNPLQAQQRVGGFGNAAPGTPYAPPPAAGGSSGTPYNAGIAGSPSEPETSGRQFCTQCGMQLQEDARFCTVCGAAA